MSSNSENIEAIEAKLCAYVEGVLDEKDRAEIERHLEANPQHRKLLADLGRTREMLRARPHESSPPDIMEALQGHLERGAFLDATGMPESEPALQINRWLTFCSA